MASLANLSQPMLGSTGAAEAGSGSPSSPSTPSLPPSRPVTRQSPTKPVQQAEPAEAKEEDREGSLPALSHSSSPSSAGSPPLPDQDPNVPRFVQPASFYKSEHSIDPDVFSGWVGGSTIGPRPKVWLSPEDDEEAKRGIPVFEPTMEEFADFEGYMTKVDHWGRRSGIVKVIPPKEWVAALPPIDPSAIANIKIKHPIQQNMVGITGLFRQQNVEKKKSLSVEEWFNKCTDKKFAAPVLKEKDRSDRPVNNIRKKKKDKTDTVVVPASDPASNEAEPEVVEQDSEMEALNEESTSSHAVASTSALLPTDSSAPAVSEPGTPSAGGPSPTKKAKLGDPAPSAPVTEFYKTLLEERPWFTEGRKKEDFTVEACREIERKFWRGLGVGESAWYGADMQGTLFTDETKDWNVGKLPNLLNRLKLKKQLPGVNTPYLYWGMWRSSFCWHVEDMDLYSVNYIHFGAPKCWYAIPQAKADKFERVMKGYFTADEHSCDQFLRHKSFAVSPIRLERDALRPNVLVQHENEFVFTFPRGYHAGFNMDFNCAESINFAIDSWVELGRRAKVCECVADSVKIDVDAVLAEHELLTEIERQKALKAAAALLPKPAPVPKKRKLAIEGSTNGASPSPAGSPAPSSSGAIKKAKTQPSLPPSDARPFATFQSAPPPPPPPVVYQPPEPPCVLCPSLERFDLMPVVAVPPSISQTNTEPGKVWLAHERCAANIPETYFVDVNVPDGRGGVRQIKMIEGVTGVSKDRWALGCAVCTKTSFKKMGGKIQCTKGKCLRAFHVTCALASPDVVLHDVEVTEYVSVKNAEGVDEKVPQQTWKTECLCPTHNPIVKERKKVELAEHRSRTLRALVPGTIIRVKGKNAQQYDVPCLSVDIEGQTVTVKWDDGTSSTLPWGNVILNPPPDHQPAVVTTAHYQPHSYRHDYVYDPKMPVPRARLPVASTPAPGPSQYPVQQQQQQQHPHQRHPSYPPSYGQMGVNVGQQYQPPSYPMNAVASSSTHQHQHQPYGYPPAPPAMYHYPAPPHHQHQHQHQRQQTYPPAHQHPALRPPSFPFSGPPGPSPVSYGGGGGAGYYPAPPQHHHQRHLSHPSNPHLSPNPPIPHPLLAPPPQSQPPPLPMSSSTSTVPAHLKDLASSYLSAPPAAFATGPGGGIELTPAIRELMRRNKKIREAFGVAGWDPELEAGGVGE